MFIHKYSDGDQALYMISDKASRPAEIINLSPDSWKGRSTGADVAHAVKFLNALSFTEDAPKKEEVEEKVEVKETPEAKETKKKAAEALDALAEEIQEQDPVVAYLIDRVSDQLEGK